MTPPIIETPRGSIVINQYGRAELKWKTTFHQKWQKQYSASQQFVDAEVLRLSQPYLPLLTGTLINTGILGTDIGSGTVQWIAPYARRQYYRGRRPGRSQSGPLRGRLWFERMKAVSGKKIIAGAKKLVGSVR